MCWKLAFCVHCVWRNSSFYQKVQSSLCDYRDGEFPWTMRLHQILFQVKESCYGRLWNVEDNFGEQKLNLVNGKVRGHLDRRRQGKWEATSSQCWFVSFDQKGIVHKEFVPPCQTVNAAFYVEVLKRLREDVRRKRPDQWWNNTWLLHHDNAPAHAALLTRRLLTDNNMTVVSHPPYSPNLAHSDFFLFPKLKMKFKGRRFQTEETQAESPAVLNTLR